jgi:hypothetical protein
VECVKFTCMERKSAQVSEETKQAEEAPLWLRARLQRTAEPCVWMERMLTALVEGGLFRRSRVVFPEASP